MLSGLRTDEAFVGGGGPDGAGGHWVGRLGADARIFENGNHRIEKQNGNIGSGCQ